MNKYDVVVVGLGAMGSAALYQLSKTGLKVAGIDQFAPPHSRGSSYGESRVTRQAIGEETFYTPLVLRANGIWSELEALSGTTLNHRCGMLIAGYSTQIFTNNTLTAAEAYHIDHEILEPAEVERRFPAIAAAGTDHLYYYEPGAGYLTPEACVKVQLRAARDHGAEIFTNSPVSSVHETSSGVEIQLGHEIITTGRVVVAAGPWISGLLPEALGSVLTTYLQTLYWFDTDKSHYSDLAPGKLPVLLGGVQNAERTRSFYGFPALAGPAGGVKFALHESQVTTRPEGKDAATPSQADLEELTGYVTKYVRHVKPKIIRSFNCIYTSTPDENFIIDFVPGSKRIIIASACSGHGFKYSAAIGEMLSQLATDTPPAIDLTPFAISRFAS